MMCIRFDNLQKGTLHRGRPGGVIYRMMRVSVLSEDNVRNGVQIASVGRSQELAAFKELTEIEFGGCRDVPHDHPCGVHGHHKISGVFQCTGLLTENIIDLKV